MLKWLFNLFRPVSTDERRQRDVYKATDKALDYISRHETINEYNPVGINWIDADGEMGNIPFLYHANFPGLRVAGLYHILSRTITMPHARGYHHYPTLKHEIAHAILATANIYRHDERFDRYFFAWGDSRKATGLNAMQWIAQKQPPQLCHHISSDGQWLADTMEAKDNE